MVCDSQLSVSYAKRPSGKSGWQFGYTDKLRSFSKKLGSFNNKPKSFNKKLPSFTDKQNWTANQG